MLLVYTICASASTTYRFVKFPPRTMTGLNTVGEWLLENG